uniref:Uncharacterized protein n=1 Tax=Rhipicephalus zambeziensis TaxID=60191 RepID=A0A224YI11_9ACAR
MSSYFSSTMSFFFDMSIQYCVFLPLDLWTKHAIRTHGSLAERLHIWRSEAQILVVVSLMLGLWWMRVPWLLLLLAACAYCSGRGWSPSLALEAAASRVFTLWFQCMECIGVAVDGGLRKVGAPPAVENGAGGHGGADDDASSHNHEPADDRRIPAAPLARSGPLAA